MNQQFQLELFELPDGMHQLNLVTPEPGYGLTALDVSALIHALAITRETMLPRVPMEAPQLEGMQHVADDPAARWMYDVMNDRFAIALAHPGHGWVGYSLSIQTAEALHSSLQELLDLRTKQRARPN